jgi:hypothetical protein
VLKALGLCERVTKGEKNGRAGLLRYTTDVRSTWERTRGGAPLCLLNHRLTSARASCLGKRRIPTLYQRGLGQVLISSRALQRALDGQTLWSTEELWA